MRPMRTETPTVIGGLHRLESMSKERLLEFTTGERLFLSASLDFLLRSPFLESKRRFLKPKGWGPWMGVFKEDVTATKRKFNNERTWKESWNGYQGKFNEHDLWILYMGTFEVLGAYDKKRPVESRNPLKKKTTWVPTNNSDFIKATRRLHGKLLSLRGFDNDVVRSLLAA